eukprot:gene17396-biopygen803
MQAERPELPHPSPPFAPLKSPNRIQTVPNRTVPEPPGMGKEQLLNPPHGVPEPSPNPGEPLKTGPVNIFQKKHGTCKHIPKKRVRAPDGPFSNWLSPQLQKKITTGQGTPWGGFSNCSLPIPGGSGTVRFGTVWMRFGDFKGAKGGEGCGSSGRSACIFS